jgi:pyruvate/2-oxoglutarate/acetoin dehydrogenase E1 component
MHERKEDQSLVTYAEAIKEAFDLALERDPSVIIVGEGVPDPKSIFGSTKGLKDKYGDSRVFDMPLSENGMTGICIGAALNGLSPVLIHQRIDFALLSLDQIINNAAKWQYMFNGAQNVKIVIRMIIGRGWGQGPQHSQSLQSIFAQIPGLKVIMPSTPKDAKGMMLSSIKDKNPVIFIEHRWLHNVTDKISKEYYEIRIDKANIIKEGKDVTVVGMSLSTLEALEAAKHIKADYKIDAEVIDLRSIRPIDYETIFVSLRKTGRLIVVDTGYKSFGIGAEIVSTCMINCYEYIKSPPEIIGLPDYPCPTAESLAENYYPSEIEISKAIFKSVGKNNINNAFYEKIKKKNKHDIPFVGYTGPF